MHVAQVIQLVHGPWVDSIKRYGDFLDKKEGSLQGVSQLPTLRECISGAVPITPNEELISDSREKLTELKRLNSNNLTKISLNPREDISDISPDMMIAFNSLYNDVEAMTVELGKYLTTLEQHLS